MNYTEGSVCTHTAAAAIKRGQFVKFNAGNVTPCSVAGEQAFGVANNDAASGQPCEVVLVGVALVRTAAALSVGAAVTTDANGNAVAASTSGHKINGVMQQSGIVVDGTSYHLARCLLRDGLTAVA